MKKQVFFRRFCLRCEKRYTPASKFSRVCNPCTFKNRKIGHAKWLEAMRTKQMEKLQPYASNQER